MYESSDNLYFQKDISKTHHGFSVCYRGSLSVNTRLIWFVVIIGNGICHREFHRTWHLCILLMINEQWRSAMTNIIMNVKCDKWVEPIRRRRMTKCVKRSQGVSKGQEQHGHVWNSLFSRQHHHMWTISVSFPRRRLMLHKRCVWFLAGSRAWLVACLTM